MSKDWQVAQHHDTLDSYREFLRHHPRGEMPDKARARIEDLEADQDWRSAQVEDSLEALQQFVQTHPRDRRAATATARITAMRADEPAWSRAKELNATIGYEDFVRAHPQSPFIEHARGRMVDLEVAEILKGPHGALPSATRVATVQGRAYGVVNIHNDTAYQLTVRYSGPESFKVVMAPQERGSIELRSGAYTVAASVDAARVRDYAGTDTVTGSNYEVEFYIASSITSYRAPRIISASGFAQWPVKRAVPDFLKGGE